MKGSYGGYTWTSNKDLSRQLGYCETYVTGWLRSHPGCAIEELIDKANKNAPVNTYKGITWTTLAGLSLFLGYSRTHGSMWLRNHKGKSVEDYIDYVLEKTHGGAIGYKGYRWYDLKDISMQLGCQPEFCGLWLQQNPGKTVSDFIDEWEVIEK